MALSEEGNCSTGPQGPIGEWDVSKMSDLGSMFMGASWFTSDISKWNVGAVPVHIFGSPKEKPS